MENQIIFQNNRNLSIDNTSMCMDSILVLMFENELVMAIQTVLSDFEIA